MWGILIFHAGAVFGLDAEVYLNRSRTLCFFVGPERPKLMNSDLAWRQWKSTPSLLETRVPSINDVI